MLAATLSWKYPRALGLMAAGEGTRQGLVLPTARGALAPLNMLDPGQDSATDVVLDIAGERLVLGDDTIPWPPRASACAR